MPPWAQFGPDMLTLARPELPNPGFTVVVPATSSFIWNGLPFSAGELLCHCENPMKVHAAWGFAGASQELAAAPEGGLVRMWKASS